jgi:hypothetical protein
MENDLTGKYVSATYGNLVQYIDGSYYTGTGILIPSSGVGAQGIQGIQGITGHFGIDGSQGIQGAQGLQGIQGSQGIQGHQGIQGTQGIQGSDGLQGIQGNIGLGTQGIQGIQGITGVQGTQGIQGTSFSDASLSLYVLKSGGTMTGSLILTSIVNSSDAINRYYVDSSLQHYYTKIEVDSSFALKTIDPSLDYTTYSPRTANTSIYYDVNNNISRIITVNDLGTIDVSYIYDSNDDVSIITINKYNKYIKNISVLRDSSNTILSISVY